MPFPTGYEEAKVFEGYEKLTPGGHKCTIRSMSFKFSKAGNYMIEMELDTSKEDTQPTFFLNKYIADNQAGRDPVWRCVHRIIVDERVTNRDGQAYGISNLKQINTAVKDSNDGNEVNDKFYVIAADAEGKMQDPLVITNQRRFCEQFANKKIGVVFREEEYGDPVTGELRVSVKPVRLCNYEKAFEQKVPDRKRQEPKATGNEQWMQVDLSDEGLPFH